jgi:hypothetical protein
MFRFPSASLIAIASLIALVACESAPSTKTPTSPTSSPSAVSQSHSSHTKININTAILSELDKLEAKLGIPALSNKIQAGRPYGKIEDLVAKKLITQAQLEQIKDIVSVEEVVLTGEAKDVDYLTKLGLMKGHLLVAKELLDLQKPEQAEPHIGHPVEEIYVDVEDQLKERQVKEFKTSLISLQDLLKSKPKDAQVKTNFDVAMQAVDGAIQKLPETQRQSPAFILKAIASLLDAANSEYGAAVSNGKITAAIEYQDSRGFVLYADALYQSISEKMVKEYPAVHKGISESMTQLKTTWPAPIPPNAPVKTPEQVSKLIQTIEKNTQEVGNK